MNKAHPMYIAAYAHAYVYMDIRGDNPLAANRARAAAEAAGAAALDAYNITLSAEMPRLEVLAKAAFEASKAQAVERWKSNDSITGMVVREAQAMLTWEAMDANMRENWIVTVMAVLARLPGDIVSKMELP